AWSRARSRRRCGSNGPPGPTANCGWGCWWRWRRPSLAGRGEPLAELRPLRPEKQFHGLLAGHADLDAQGLRLGRGVDDLRVEQVFRLDQRAGRRPPADRHRLVEVGRRGAVVDAAADPPGTGEDGAILPAVPAIADADPC